MAGRPDSFMPMYWGDYMRDTGHLTAAEHGAYLMLIARYWGAGAALLDDDAQLQRTARMTPMEWRKARPVIAALFKIEDGKWTHKRIDSEIERARKRFSERSAAGRKGNAKRWPSESQTDRSAIAERSQPQPEPGKKEGSEPNGSGAAPLIFDPGKVIFDQGLGYLMGTGIPENQARGLLGKWRKAVGNGAVIDLISEAQKLAVSEPVGWIEGAIKARNVAKTREERIRTEIGPL